MSLRVLQICCAPPPNGVRLSELLTRWPTITDVAEATAAAGAEVTVLLDGAASEELCRGNVRYRQVRGLGRPEWGTLRPRAARLAQQHAPDIIHMMGLESPIVTRALCETAIPVLAQDHASQPRQLRAALWRWGMAGLAGAAFTAHAQAEPFLRDRQLSTRTRIFAIPESSSHFTPGPRDLARAHTGIFGAPALLWVGHLNANKNPMMVLRAVQKAMSRLPKLQLWCAFVNAPLLAEVRALLDDDPDLRSRVHLLGRLPHVEMEAAYRASDAFVSASWIEGSGYALIEALACGLRVIATDIPSFRAMTGDGAVGSLVPRDDSDAMAEAICHEFAVSPSHDEATRDEVRRHFDEHLSFDRVGAKLVEAYRVLAAVSPRCA